MLRIPRKNRDLRRHVVIRTTFRVVGYLLWLAIWYGGALAYNYNHQTYPYERQMTGWRMAVWMAISVLMGIILFRMWKLSLFYSDSAARCA